MKTYVINNIHHVDAMNEEDAMQIMSEYNSGFRSLPVRKVGAKAIYVLEEGSDIIKECE